VRVVVVGIGGVRVGVMVVVVLAEAGRLVLVAPVGVEVLMVVVALVAVIHVRLLRRIVHTVWQIFRRGGDLGAAAGIGGEEPARQQHRGCGDPRSECTTRRPTHVSEF